ncbi:MAG: cation:dicarboxylase symporter family transporter, partial [Caulobacter sp.]
MNRLFAYLIIGSMVLGILVGWICNITLQPEQIEQVATGLKVLTDLFLRLIKMIIAPLVFATLVSGIAHMEDAGAIGRVGVKTMGWFIGASLVSLTIGLIMVHIIQPGSGLSLTPP